jgi:radical SAM superfamily enzyme YgiQ (UPF0313 family)
MKVIFMKTILVGINSKFIHPNLAIRYLKANCDFPIELMEYTIKDSEAEIYSAIINANPNIIGFSCYIWNIKHIYNIAKKLKEYNSNYIIIFGGPEVSYEYDTYLKEKIADFIIVNEGEHAFNKLIMALNDNQSIKAIENLAYLKSDLIIRNSQKTIDNLDSLKSPYEFIEDFETIKNKVQYVELSRGCPYKCSYCLASLETGLRFFEMSKTLEKIDFLISKGARTIKFLDRSFNANKRIALNFFEALIKKDYHNTVFQFEINGDILSPEIIEYLTKNLKKDYFRFELGIQSTNNQVNQAIDRIQDTEGLIKNIKAMQKSKLILHLDLIAGLPYEDLDSFKKTFNQIFLLFAEELQLGFLKMLRGTKMRKEASKFNYTYNEDPPYEIIENKFITADELNQIHKVEDLLEIYWNKGFMNEAMKTILRNNDNPFDFFLDLADYYDKNQLLTHNYQLFNLFTNLISFLKETDRMTQEINDQLKLDYIRYHKIKPKIYWSNNFTKNHILRSFFEFNKAHQLDTLYKYSMVCEYKSGYLITLFLPTEKEIYYFNNQSIKKIS